MTYDAIIIGAGMSGLAAGIRLAHFERKVCILERHSVIGGLNSFYRRGGRNLDVGLHALTNYAPTGAKNRPLSRIMRQLRLAWEEFSLAPQVGSAIRFPGAELNFTNDYKLFESEVHRRFPREKDNFARLVGELCDYDHIDQPSVRHSAKEHVAERVKDPLLREMLFCPLMFYGSAHEHDMDFGQFSILFRSIFLEGLARPFAGVRLILKRLVDKFKNLGGELRLRAGVSRIAVKDGAATKVVLDDGVELEAKNVLSSAGWPETLRMCAEPSSERAADPGRLTFVESIAILDSPPEKLGHDKTIVFFNDSEKFHYAAPEEAADVRSGVICSPNNFDYDEPMPENVLRISTLANYARWAELDEVEYRLAKLRWFDRAAAAAARFMPEFRHAVIDTDMFTPLTIHRYTGHEGGAVYGSTQKRYDGTTHLKNLFICGNDQGLVGIVGAILSGIGIVNKYLLKE
ncbi:MAG: NAD(P)/FAD-dependent oxidoreductase [Pirellulales bacterium]|nr:NAD(P)/FAD-dependent oxidoreductase [Pirellulales bacterium]